MGANLFLLFLRLGIWYMGNFFLVRFPLSHSRERGSMNEYLRAKKQETARGYTGHACASENLDRDAAWVVIEPHEPRGTAGNVSHTEDNLRASCEVTHKSLPSGSSSSKELRN